MDFTWLRFIGINTVTKGLGWTSFIVAYWRYTTWGILIIIGLGNGLSAVRHQAITWTNIDLLKIGPLGTNFSEILIMIE